MTTMIDLIPRSRAAYSSLLNLRLQSTLGRLCSTCPSENQPLAMLWIFFDSDHLNIQSSPKKIFLPHTYRPLSAQCGKMAALSAEIFWLWNFGKFWLDFELWVQKSNEIYNRAEKIWNFEQFWHFQNWDFTIKNYRYTKIRLDLS